MAIRVLIAEDQVNMRDALVDLVGSDEGMEVVAAVAGADSAIELCRRLRPDVAILDVKMPEGGGVEAATGIGQISPHTAVIALSAYDDDGARTAMAQAGAVRYILKGGKVDELLDAIHDAAHPGARGSGDTDR